MGCSPIKAARELGLERRETVGVIRAVYKFGYLLETPSIRRYSFMRTRFMSVSTSSDNAIGADNQQERLDAYIAVHVDGEGSFMCFNPRTKDNTLVFVVRK